MVAEVAMIGQADKLKKLLKKPKEDMSATPPSTSCFHCRHG